MFTTTLRRLHWPQLLLLALLPLALVLAQGLPPALRLFGWLVFAAAVLGLAERWQPARADWQWRREDAPRDGGVFTLNVLVDGIASVLIALVVLGLSTQAAPTAFAHAWVEVPLALVVAEFGSYWLHRLSHHGGWLWRVHLLHHRPERLNLGNALTAHPINALYDKLARTLPLVVLGFSTDVIEIATLFALTQALVTHANIAGTIGPLNWLIGSAEQHRLHHSTDPDQAGNFGTALPLWDQLFGTFRNGTAPEHVGVFDPRDYPGEHEVAALLRWPLQR
jgi:sterol desaturase/sphingolipid hydroxylase (fatty acid hydroxylase superfamily)